MEPTLNQERIGDLRQKAQSFASAVISAAGDQKVAAFEVQASGKLSTDQSQSISALHETFNKRVCESVRKLLGTVFEMNLLAAEQRTYSQFLDQTPDPAYLTSLSSRSPDACTVLQMDLSLFFPILDLILGGTGKNLAEPRYPTEIEGELFESVNRIVAYELVTAWHSILEIAFKIGGAVQKTQAQGLMPLPEKILLLTFEIRLPDGPEAQGKLRLAIPSALFTVLLRKSATQAQPSEPVTVQKSQPRLQELLLDSKFRTELILPPSTISVRDLLKLDAGGLLVLQSRANEPIHFNVAGKSMFLASPVCCGSQRGAQIQELLSIIPKQGKEAE